MTQEECDAITREKVRRLHELNELAKAMGVTEPGPEAPSLGSYAEDDPQAHFGTAIQTEGQADNGNN